MKDKTSKLGFGRINRCSLCQESRKNILKSVQGVPGGSVVKNLLASAGGIDLILGTERFPHVAKQLSPWAMTTEPVL